MKKTFVYIFLFATSFLYQNFTSSSLKFTGLNEVDHATRVEHARELLGKKYKGSEAQKAEMLSNFNFGLYAEVAQSLPMEYKPKAIKITDAIILEAYEHDLDPVFLYAVIKTESQFNPLAHGSHGEIGLMQIKPDTAAWVAKKMNIKWRGSRSLENPIENIKLGAAYFSMLREKTNGKANHYLSSYNLGPAKVRNMYKASHVPKEYSLKVMKNYKNCYQKIVSNSQMFAHEVF